jgi:UDP-N-acetylglucosamine 2-epimerase (non-hydrolysing)
VRVLSVVGARPQFIKSVALSRVLQGHHDEHLLHTGQHYDESLSGVFFDELDVEDPAYTLGVGSDTHGRQTAAMLEGIEAAIEDASPDVVVLYGDTNSTVAGALAAAKTDPLVAHVEAGLRSYNREMPEETNRIVTDHISDLLFCPSESAVDTLAEEGLTEGVHEVGDVMFDMILWVRDRARTRSDVLERLALDPDEYVLSTVHRAGTTDDQDRLASVVEALGEVPQSVVLPVHPRTEDRLRSFDLWDRATDLLRVVDPVGYVDFVRLVDGASRVATDSGGVQKEAFYLDTPCVTMREETEWRETVDCGWNRLVGTDRDAIRAALTTDDWPETKPPLYGDGDAAPRIVDVLESSVG